MNRDDAFAVMAALLGIVVGVVSEADMRKFAQAAALERGTRIMTLTYPATTATPIDRNPDLCWRCDTRTAANDLGLCEPCREVLR